MTAAALPPQTGLKRLAAALGLLCAVLFLLAVENRLAVEAVRALQTGAGAVAAQAARAAGEAPFRAADGVAGLRRSLPFAPPVPAAPEDVVLAGEFVIADGSAPGSVAFAGAQVVFGSGESFRTEPLRIAAGAEPFAGGQTFARRLNARADAQIELRRIVSPRAGGRVPASPLCDGAPPVRLALLHRTGQVDLMLFREGGSAGVEGRAGVLCGVWTFERR